MTFENRFVKILYKTRVECTGYQTYDGIIDRNTKVTW